jgi:hypothetical protein
MSDPVPASELVERPRECDDCEGCLDAADRIEHLEHVVVVKAELYALLLARWEAERALADMLAEALQRSNSAWEAAHDVSDVLAARDARQAALAAHRERRRT